MHRDWCSLIRCQVNHTFSISFCATLSVNENINTCCCLSRAHELVSGVSTLTYVHLLFQMQVCKELYNLVVLCCNADAMQLPPTISSECLILEETARSLTRLAWVNVLSVNVAIQTWQFNDRKFLSRQHRSSQTNLLGNLRSSSLKWRLKAHSVSSVWARLRQSSTGADSQQDKRYPTAAIANPTLADPAVRSKCYTRGTLPTAHRSISQTEESGRLLGNCNFLLLGSKIIGLCQEGLLSLGA